MSSAHVDSAALDATITTTTAATTIGCGNSDKALQALSLFESLRAALDADGTRAVAGAAGVAAPHSGDKSGLKAPPRPRKVAVGGSGKAAPPPAEDAERSLLRRQLAHAEGLVKQLHDKNTALRGRIQRLESDAAAAANALASNSPNGVTMTVSGSLAKAAAATTTTTPSLTAEHAAAIAQLQAQVWELWATLEREREERRIEGRRHRWELERPTATLPIPIPPSPLVERRPSALLSLRATALASELTAATARLTSCEAQRDRLAEVALAPLLLLPSSSSSLSPSKAEARTARLVNEEVRKLFTALRWQLAEEACAREGERARRCELLLLLDRQAALEEL